MFTIHNTFNNFLNKLQRTLNQIFTNILTGKTEALKQLVYVMTQHVLVFQEIKVEPIILGYLFKVIITLECM